jgi:hypothetical protein
MDYTNDEKELDDMVHLHLLDDTFLVRPATSAIWQRVAKAIPIALAICVTNLITFFLSRHYYNIDSSYCLQWQGESHSFYMSPPHLVSSHGDQRLIRRDRTFA